MFRPNDSARMTSNLSTKLHGEICLWWNHVTINPSQTPPCYCKSQSTHSDPKTSNTSTETNHAVSTGQMKTYLGRSADYQCPGDWCWWCKVKLCGVTTHDGRTGRQATLWWQIETEVRTNEGGERGDRWNSDVFNVTKITGRAEIANRLLGTCVS